MAKGGNQKAIHLYKTEKDIGANPFQVDPEGGAVDGKES
jgi:hypothetical protein